MTRSQHEVILRVYSIGNEELGKLVGSILKKPDVGMWHSSIEVYGTEYYFQNGIMQAVPGTTMYGHPKKFHNLGVTEIPKIVFEDFLSSIAQDFSPDSYHFLKNNCNNFTDVLSSYLVERNIPEYVLELQKAVLESEVLSSVVDSILGFSGRP